MKKIFLAFITIMSLNTVQAQMIRLLSDSIISKADSSAITYTLSYTIAGASPTQTFKVTLFDSQSGTAKQGIDYFIVPTPTTKTLSFASPDKSYVIVIYKTAKCDIQNKTIILNVKAIPTPDGDTSYSSTFTLTIHRTDAASLTKAERDACKTNAKSIGENWRSTNNIPRNIDETNVARTEFISYADLKGFDPDQPNGLAQTQFIFKWPIIKRWAVNHENFKMQFLRSFLLPDFLFNRIDKTNDFLLYRPVIDSFKSVNSNIIDSFVLRSKLINSFDVVKYANFIGNGKLVFLNLQFPRSRAQFEYNISIYRMRVDSSKIAQSYDPVYALGHGPALFFETGLPGLPDAFQLRTIIGYENIYLRSNSFSQVDSISSTIPQNNLSSIKSSAIYPAINKSSKLWQFSARLSRSVSKDDKSQIFFRYNLNWQKINRDKSDGLQSKNAYNFYSQFQVGLQLNINIFGTQ